MCIIKINYEERALIDTRDGEVLRPSCFDSLAALYSYKKQKGWDQAADDMLLRVFEGEKVITNMEREAQAYNINYPRKV